MAVNHVPAGYHALTPYLVVQGAARAIDFYKEVFGAREVMRMDGPNGKVGHAELEVGGSRFMISDEYPEMGFLGPQEGTRPPVGVLVYVEDVDTVFAKAVAAGATAFKPLQDQFYGDRSGTITDPFGHVWTIATHIEDVSPEQMQARHDEWMAKHQAQGAG